MDEEDDEVEAVVEKKAKGKKAVEEDGVRAVAEKKGKGKRVSEEELEVKPKKKAKAKVAEETPFVEPRAPAVVPEASKTGEKQPKARKEVVIPPTASLSAPTIEALNTKPKNRKSSVPADVLPATSPEAPDNTSSKKKRRKSESGDGAKTSPAPPKALATGTTPQHPATTKKERKFLSDEEKAAAKAEREKTSHALMASISEEISARGRPNSSEEIQADKKDKKKKRKAETADAGSPLVPARTQDLAKPDTELHTKLDSKIETTKNAALSSSEGKGGKNLGKEDLKRKRSAEGGERKKNKVVKGTTARSAKDGIIGMKSRGTA
jgi:hypothetical protein